MKELSNKSKIKQVKQIFSFEPTWEVDMSCLELPELPIEDIIARAGKDIFSEIEIRGKYYMKFEGPEIIFDEENRDGYVDLDTILTFLAFGKMFILECFSRTNEDKTVNYITLDQDFSLNLPIPISHSEFLGLNLIYVYEEGQ